MPARGSPSLGNLPHSPPSSPTVRCCMYFAIKSRAFCFDDSDRGPCSLTQVGFLLARWRAGRLSEWFILHVILVLTVGNSEEWGQRRVRTKGPPNHGLLHPHAVSPPAAELEACVPPLPSSLWRCVASLDEGPCTIRSCEWSPCGRCVPAGFPSCCLVLFTHACLRVAWNRSPRNVVISLTERPPLLARLAP